MVANPRIATDVRRRSFQRFEILPRSKMHSNRNIHETSRTGRQGHLPDHRHSPMPALLHQQVTLSPKASAQATHRRLAAALLLAVLTRAILARHQPL